MKVVLLNQTENLYIDDIRNINFEFIFKNNPLNRLKMVTLLRLTTGYVLFTR